MTKYVQATTPADAVARAIRVDYGPIEYRDPDSLKAYPGNPRKHSKKQLTKARAAIREYGITKPVLVTPDGVIVAGHLIVSAAIAEGTPAIPTLCLSGMTPEQIRQYRIADNQLGDLSEWDMDALSVELQAIIDVADISIVETMAFDIPDVEILLDGGVEKKVAEDPADLILEPPVTPISRLGDLWCLDDHRVLCASSLEPENWARLMAGEQAAMAFCDGPFNVPVQGHVSGLGKIRHEEFQMASGEMSEAEFIAFNRRYLELVAAQLVDGALIGACIDWRGDFALQTGAREAALRLKNMCVWNKSNAGMGSLWRSQHELVLIFKKGTAPHINNVNLGAHGRFRTNVWDFAGANSFGRDRMEDLKNHATPKPVAMVAEFIRDVSHRGHVVIDAFLGSGTTILAAERTGRRGYGIEIEPRFVDVAIRRWERMTGKSAILAEDGRTFSEVAADRAAEAEVAYRPAA